MIKSNDNDLSMQQTLGYNGTNNQRRNIVHIFVCPSSYVPLYKCVGLITKLRCFVAILNIKTLVVDVTLTLRLNLFPTY